MKTLKLLLLLFSIGILGAYAEDTDISNVDNTLYIENVTVEKGTQVTLPLKMKNNLSITGFQCNLYFPEGVTVQKDEDDYPLIELSTERTTAKNTNIFEAVEQADGSIMILANSTKSKSFTGTDGEVATITLKISSDISSGNHTASIKGIALSDVTGVSHDASDVNFTITVKTDEEPVEITANSYTIKYGDDIPDFGYTSTGSEVKGVPAISCEATSSSPVGTYDIVVSKGTVENTKVTFVKGTLTIEKAPLAITAKSYTRKQGEANPTFEVEYEGFKNSETESVLTEKPTFTCSATASSAPGEYEIIPSGASATNYDISYVNGKLTVTDADPVTITAKSYTITYGDALPKFEYETTGAVLSGTPQLNCTATSTSNVGTYDIVISKGTVTNYNVTYVKGTLTIEKAPLTITAKNYTRKQGEANPTFEVEYEGFKNSETESVLTEKPTLTCSATASSAPGEYVIIPSGASATNYVISYVNGKLTVTDADPVTITAKSYTITYGDALPKFEYETTGAVLSGTPQLNCTATSTSNVGTYDIVISKGTVTNYNVTYVKGTLTIEKAPLTITAKNYTRKQGEDNPTFEVEYEGFKNSETESVLAKKPIVTCSATAPSAPGEYDIIPSSASATNYEISYVNGKLTVTNADPVTITAKSYTITYGDALPKFEYETTGAVLSGTPQLNCTATSTSNVGTYDIVISKGTVTNYNVTYVKGTLTIEKAPLTISGGTYTMKQGDALPELKAEYKGFKNGETEDVLTKKPTLSTTATSSSNPGEYEVTVADAEAQNYEITYEPGKIIVTQTVRIENIELNGKSFCIYNLQGQRLRNTKKGINIINGKKVIVK